jgi:predicted secreted hydrolase
MYAQQGDFGIELTLEAVKPPVLHGESGYSRKGPEPGNASYYYSQTRLQTTGIVTTGSGTYTVRGLSWKDHEFSTSALSEGQVGWDWFSLQLDRGSELMFFQLRREDGSIDPYSSGTWIAPNGETTHLAREDFTVRVEDTWRSPENSAEYPSAWTVTIPSLGLEVDIRPYLADQEMNVSYDYWEGAVQVTGTASDGEVTGSGYVEMTGYAEAMEGDF